MNANIKSVVTNAVVYSGAGLPFAPGEKVPLPIDHAADLIASGHVLELPADLPEVKPASPKAAATKPPLD